MVFQNNLLAGASGATGAQAAFDTTLIGNSVWFDGAADLFTKSSFAGHASKKVISVWVQRTGFSAFGLIRGTNGTGDRVGFGDNVSNNQAYVVVNGKNLYSNRIFRDIGWYHYLVSFDLTQSVAVNKVKVYINGVDLDGSGGWQTDERSSMSSSFATFDSSSVAQQIGRDGSGAMYLNAYLAQYCELDGQSIQSGDVATTDFYGTFTFGTNGSQIIPKKDSDIAALASTAGGNSFCLDFADSSGTNAVNLGNDISSNNNDFTPTSMSTANHSSNTPSNSYPILNVLDPTTATASSGNLNFAGPSADNKAAMRTTIGIPDNSGKFYWEYALTGGSNDAVMIGIAGDGSANGGYDDWVQDITPQVAVYTEGSGNVLYVDGSNTNSSFFGSSPTGGDVIGVAYDSDTRKVWFALNNTYAGSGNPAAGSGESATLSSSGTAFPTVSARGSSDTLTLRFDSSDFSYSAPTGYKELNTANLTAPTYQGIDYFDATLYEGNGFNQRVGDFVPFTDTYTVDKSVFFDDGDRRYLAKTFDSGDATATSTPGGSNSAKATISFWIKYCRSVGSGDQHIFSTANTAQTQRFMIYRNESSAEDFFFINMNPGPKMFKAPVQSALLSEQEWSNVVINVDLDNSTGADKIKMFVNGVQITSVDTTYQSASNSNYFLFANEDHFIGNLAPADAGYTGFCLDSYLAEMHVIDGHVKAPTDFGQVDTATNRWVAKDYKTNVNTYGNRGFYMAFDNASGTSDGVGTDSSGNNFHFTESFVSGGSAWTSTDTVTDTPSKNYPIFSSKNIGSATATLSEGNLKFTSADNGGFPITMQPTSGKWYFEVELDTAGSYYPGLFTAAGLSYTGTSSWAQTSSFVYLVNNPNGAVYNGSAVVNGYNTGAMSNSDRLAIAWDVDNRLIYYGLASGGSTTFFSSGNPVARTGAAPFNLPNERLYFGVVSGGTSAVATHHFISSGWIGAAPTGFSELNQDNLDDTASKITAWAWIKNRDATDSNMFFDRVRGIGKDLHSDSTAAEATDVNTVQRFLQRGVQVGNDAEVNTANESFVLWQWLAGDSATTGTSIGAGSISTGVPSLASTVIAADAGHFSVVGWTMSDPAGAKTLGHGLSGAPELIFVKNRTDAGTNWPVFSEAAGNTKYQYLSTTAAAQTFNMWQNTSPDEDVFYVNSNNEASGSANDEMIAYCFRSVPGVCKVGSYEGNGASGDPNADGTYISMGFKPRWIMVKVIDSSVGSDGNWTIYDTARQPFNSTTSSPTFFADNVNPTSGPERSNSHNIDILSDGVKFRDNSNQTNSARTYLYLAMAEIGGNGTLPPIYGR